MKPSYWQYTDTDKQTVHFRGRVLVYDENKVDYISCTEVRKNKLMAISDAKKLMKKLKNETSLLWKGNL